MNAAACAETRRASQAEASHEREDRKPLYLGVRVRGRVDVEGLAFRVRSATRADARFPFARVSRIISGTGVDWSAEALHACFERGIPVIVVDRCGTPVGFFMPALAQPSSFAEAVAEFLDRPDWAEIYGCWLRATRMRILAAWRGERQARGEPVDGREFRELVRAHVYRTTSAPSDPFDESAGICRGALHAIAAQALLRWRLKAVFWTTGGGRLDLLADLTSLLALRLQLEASARMRAGLETEAAALRALEALAGKLHEEAERTLCGLARRVRELLAEWR